MSAIPLIRSSESRAKGLRAGSKLRAATFTTALVLPTIAFFGFWVYLPALYGFYLSFTDSSLIAPPNFVGVDNYTKLVGDPVFWGSLWRTFQYALEVVIPTLVCGILLARVVVRIKRGRALFMTIYFLPFVVPGVVSALVFSLLFNQYGLVNSILGTHIAWLQDESVAMVALSATTIWAMTGYYTVIFMAGYQQVPEELLEAAKLDGANAWQQFRYVEVPALTPTILFASISVTAAVITDFGTPFILNQGGPNYATTTLPLYIYNQTFQYSSAGYGESISTVLLVIALVLTFLQVLLITRRNRRTR
ncbi:carbohydrate ABC transporter permease [Leifsonia shinshuensis]|uniref:ABC-type sugar transport system permease subunit n=1 Tax=Leifsonia shinshuensis TaxID=150026 RepID=A0A853CZB3_9MICO|nr:sugar ABC transporter permease [Leifsonia shinshuensis]NYJ25928.1 ABC-type sugar transport system permease subunit [Leifsonia shinshuensis]